MEAERLDSHFHGNDRRGAGMTEERGWFTLTLSPQGRGEKEVEIAASLYSSQ
jgi:hypothetical protein